jgi:energy-coupling factor transporter ATP-binding protein EcfA2
MTLIVVTHNEELARIADRSVHMRDGLITDDGAQVRGRRRRTDGQGAKAASGPRRKASGRGPRRTPPRPKSPR